MTTIKNNILQFVEKNKINMIPRWRFVLYSLLWAVLLIFFWALLVFIGSMVVFTLTVHGLLYLPLFGMGEVIHSIRSIPTILVLLMIILVLVIELISRQYAFTFRRPMLITLCMVTLSSIVLSFVLPLTPVHLQLNEFSRKHNLAFVGYGRPEPISDKETTILRGIVMATSTYTVTLRLFDESIHLVHATSTSVWYMPEIGDDVVVFGRFTDFGFEAIEMRSLKNIFETPYSAREK